MKFLIPQADAKKSGIYIIRNTINDKIYVGSAKCLVVRFRGHKSNFILNKHKSPQLRAFVNKYGIETLQFHLIRTCEIPELLQVEQFYLDFLQPFFNTCKIAGNSLGVKRTVEQIEKLKGRQVSKETRKRMSISRMAVKTPRSVIESMRLANQGKTRPPEVVTKVAAAMKAAQAAKGPVSEETRRKMSESGKGRTPWNLGKSTFIYEGSKQQKIDKCKKPVAQYSLDNKFIKVFPSAKEAAQQLGFNAGHISMCAIGKQNTHKGYKWKRAKKTATGKPIVRLLLS